MSVSPTTLTILWIAHLQFGVWLAIRQEETHSLCQWKLIGVSDAQLFQNYLSLIIQSQMNHAIQQTKYVCKSIEMVANFLNFRDVITFLNWCGFDYYWLIKLFLGYCLNCCISQLPTFNISTADGHQLDKKYIQLAKVRINAWKKLAILFLHFKHEIIELIGEKGIV